MNSYQPTTDLAGEVCFRPNFFQTKRRIDLLIETYLNNWELCDRLEDLPQQFINPQPRQWDKIEWDNISAEQIIGIDVEVFLAIIKGALDTEAPIRGYTQTSRQYLEPIHPTMAKFVGGVATQEGKVLELGLWEKEERQHTPALRQIYQRLTREKLQPAQRKVKGYRSQTNPYEDLYQHGLHRIATEYSATCLYLWMMARTTGTIQQVLSELLKDEINHLVKFWGVGMWLYPDGWQRLSKYTWQQIAELLPSAKSEFPSTSSLTATVRRMMPILNWHSWSRECKIESIYSFVGVALRMWQWSSLLTPEYLHPLCTCVEFADGDSDFLKTESLLAH